MLISPRLKSENQACTVVIIILLSARLHGIAVQFLFRIVFSCPEQPADVINVGTCGIYQPAIDDLSIYLAN